MLNFKITTTDGQEIETDLSQVSTVLASQDLLYIRNSHGQLTKCVLSSAKELNDLLQTEVDHYGPHPGQYF